MHDLALGMDGVMLASKVQADLFGFGIHRDIDRLALVVWKAVAFWESS